MNPKIVSFTPIKDAKNFLGFCGLQLTVLLNGQQMPIVVKAKVMRNSNNGHVFITMHQESYQKQDGTTGYANVVRIPEEKFQEFNKTTAKAWDEYIAEKHGTNTQVSAPPQPIYPHGMVQNQSKPQQQYQQKQYSEELPF